MSWVDRYHVGLGAVALLIGLAVAVVDRWGPDPIQRRTLGLAGLAAAVLGGWGSDRSWPWWLLAALVVTVADDGEPDHQHPLGAWAGALAAAGLVGVWAAVPDTEPALVAAAVFVPVVAVRGATARPLGRAGTAALLVVVAGSVWVGSAGGGAALASICAVGATAVAPAVLGFGQALAGRAWWMLAAAHLVVVVAVPRVIMRWSMLAAWTVSLASLLVLAVVTAALARPRWRRSGLRVR